MCPVLICVALAVGYAQAKADDSAKAGDSSKAAVKKLAQEMGDATVRGDFAAVFDHTYPPVVKELGGRAEAIKFTESSMKPLKERGFAFKKFEIGEPGEFFVEGGNVFTVVPTTLIMSSPAGNIRVRSYLLGISPDGKASWTFVDGAGLQKEAQKKALPKMPEKLKLPEAQKPELIKDN